MNEKGEICVDLNDFEELSDSIRLRHKIDQLMVKYQFPNELSNFSITFMLRTGKRHYISNLYYWAIPLRISADSNGDYGFDPNGDFTAFERSSHNQER
ncbi:hypothetical protein [Legionella yabuuchiae]|uniref:hypothetical protein n=1 Tax=Legionella yabuuchiae TaxID=376727 RepID=UPI001056DAC4|nr:hypothetical protein [Legionella yabuuchiae]